VASSVFRERHDSDELGLKEDPGAQVGEGQAEKSTHSCDILPQVLEWIRKQGLEAEEVVLQLMLDGAITGHEVDATNVHARE
jgi:hypothetical protein